MSKRGQNEGTICKRADGRWMARLNLGYVGGKRKRKHFSGATRAEVQAQLTAALRDQQQGPPVAAERQTVAQFLAHWLEHTVKPTRSYITHRSYAKLARLYLVPHLGRPAAPALPRPAPRLRLAPVGAGGPPARGDGDARPLQHQHHHEHLQPRHAPGAARGRRSHGRAADRGPVAGGCQGGCQGTHRALISLVVERRSA